MFQQTVELAIDTETDQRIAASELLALPEAEFSAMRRQAMAERIARKKGATKARYICAVCRIALWLSRYNHEEGNRWFKHDEPSLGCPWFEGNKLSPDQRRALIYRGQQEGEEHRRLKNFIALWLEKEPGITGVDRELVTHGQILKGEWKRPDVQCVKGDKRIVFEIQLSYTFLSDVIKRDEFYRQEGIFIIWVFAFFDLRRATVRDEAFFNRRKDALKQPILDAAAALEANHNWHRGFEPLSDEEFFGWHKVLPVLMSLKLGRSVGYGADATYTPYQVLEAAVRQSTQRRVHGFAVLYLWASSIFKLQLNEKQRQWRTALAEKVKVSVEAGQATYRRVTYYDQAIVLLFPALEEKLSSSFAT